MLIYEDKLDETKSHSTAINGTPKPFIKWVGGKRQLLPEIKQRFPARFGNYFEAFVGGGAVMFSMERKQGIITINDFNAELTNVYQVVRDAVDSLIQSLAGHHNTPEYYYTIRNKDREKGFCALSNVERASRFIYLNKTGFNGLYRVNSSGQHNVPFGQYKNPTILDEETLRACSAFLQGVHILTGDFAHVLERVQAGDFVYLDPPYAPLSATSNFTAYTTHGFDDTMQFRLHEFCDQLHRIGAYFLLSNSYTPFILDLYGGYTIEQVMANRTVNCKANGRGKIAEALVRNY